MTPRAQRRALVVLGMHRSGTSAAARVFSLLGAGLPQNLMPPKEGDNPSGFWEPEELVAAHDSLLAELDSRWDDLCPLPSGWFESEAARRAQETIAELLEQEFGHTGLFVLKDPRICRTVPLWTSALRRFGAEPGFVFAFRNPLEVASSLAARDGLSLEWSLLLWLRHALDAELNTRAERRVFLSYQGLLADWSEAADRVARALELEWPIALEDAAAEVDAFLNAEQRHHTVADEDLAVRPDVVAWVKEVYGALGEAERHSDSLPDVADAVRAELDRADLAFTPVVREASARARQAEERGRELARVQSKLAVVRTQLDKSEQRQRELVENEKRANEALAQANQEARDAEERAESLAAEIVAVAPPRSLRRPGLPPWRALLQFGLWLVPPSREGLRKLRAYLELRRARVFDADYYLEHNPDIRLDPLVHYVNHGWLEQRDPNPWFSTSYYLSTHTDVAEARVNPLIHYVRYGRRNQRATRRPAEPGSPTFGLRSRTRALRPKQVRPGVLTAGLLSAARERVTAAPLSVSVVLPTYNRASTVPRALRSVLAQSYAPLEILVSDDGSTDGTQEILEQEFGAELGDGRVRVLRNPNRGVSAARNAGLAVARGDVVAYLDSDNEWDPDYLLAMVDALGRHPEAATAYAGLRVLGGPRGDFTRVAAFDRETLLYGNFIDMNVFVHRRWVAEQLGAFDEELTRLVDWDMILRYTRLYPPVLVPFLLATYYTGVGETITSRESLGTNRPRALVKHRRELTWRGLEPVRIGYVLWDWPALSQTFVVDELRRLLERGYDVKVYFRADPDAAAIIDFPVDAVRVSKPKELAEQLRRDKRTILHSHFAYPAVTRLTFPAAAKAGIPFTFMPHAVDIFNYVNEGKNRIDEIAQHPLCQRVFVYGDFHRSYLIERGVPPPKLTPTLQALPPLIAGGDVSDAVERRLRGPRRVVTAIARFIEKKGIEDLIRAADLLRDGDVEVRIYGYGPLEDRYRALVQELGLDNVRLLGSLEDADAVRAAYAEADVFALPCTRAENGDMDGLPTVLLEAMALGVPVVTTAVSGIPGIVRDGVSGLLVADRDPPALAAGLRTALEMPAQRLRRLIRNGQDTVDEYAGVDRTVDTLLDVWARPPIDIVLVTYSRDDPSRHRETEEVLRRIVEMTTTPYTLTIVDNASDAELVRELRSFAEGRDNVRVLALPENRFWGPAVNLALEQGSGEFVFYVCSNEGFVAKVGWERECLAFMRANPRVALAGHLISSPRFHDGDGYRRQPWFSNFRNRSFAKKNPKRAFHHVQGGIFVLRRAAYEECGGFNEAVAQAGADVEYSYYLESRGWELGDIKQLPSVTTKTRPPVGALIDEDTVACHPLSRETVKDLDRTVAMGGRRCNLCEWAGERFVDDGDANTCPQCGSTPFARAAYRFLAGSNLVHRKRTCAAILDADALVPELKRMFSLERHVVAQQPEATQLAHHLTHGRLARVDVLIAGPLRVTAGEEGAVAAEIDRLLAGGGMALLALANGLAFTDGDPVERLRAAFAHQGLDAEEVVYQSRVTGFENTDLLSVARLRDPPPDSASAPAADRRTRGQAKLARVRP